MKIATLSFDLLLVPSDGKLNVECIDQLGSDRTPVPLVHYIVVRADLPHGVQVAQTVHAAGESVNELFPPEPGTISVALHARDAMHLEGIYASLVRAGIGAHCIYESDAPYENQLMAIGLNPVPITERSKVREVLGGLPLVK